MRIVALDTHKNFAEVALHEDGQLRRLGRVESKKLPAFARSLGPEDHVVLESTSVTWAVVDLLAKHAGRVTVSNPMQTKAIAQAKVKTDKVDAKVLAKLGAADFLAEVWVPDEETRALRRRLAHRQGLVRQRTGLRNQVHAVLARNLVDLEASDLFGKKGRRLLAGAALPEHERDAVDATLRLHDAVDEELGRVDRSLAQAALARPEVRRLMTVPGVGPITALSIVGLVGDARRFPSPGQLVGYLGLDPRVRQSGDRAQRTGHISRQGQAHARWVLVEAAHAAVRTPGPLRAFYLRLKTRRGKQIALVAAARKLAIVCWHLLMKEEDYRYEAPSLTARKLAALERQAGAERRTRVSEETTRRALERRILEQAERAYEAEVAAKGGGAGPQGGRDSSGRRAANDARQADSPQRPALLDEDHPRRGGSYS